MSGKDPTQHDMDRWDNNELGDEEAFAVVVEGAAEALDEALELHLISIRLQKGLIEALKSIAAFHGVGYQPMVRDVLRRFVRAELRMIVDKLEEAKKQQDEIEMCEDEEMPAAYFDRAAA